MKKIIYHHIPKCAGMSLVMGLAISYYPLTLLRYGKKGFTGRLNARAAHDTAAALDKDDYSLRRELLYYQCAWGDAPFISGHYPFCPKVYADFKNEWDFVTVIRDPVARWYSEYYWNRYKDHDYKATDKDIEGYFASEGGQFNTKLYMNFFTNRTEKTAKATQEQLDQALKAAQGFSVIGDISGMQQFKTAMKNKYGRSPYIPKKNTSPAPKEVVKKPDENSDFHKALLQSLEADIEFYRKVSP